MDELLIAFLVRYTHRCLKLALHRAHLAVVLGQIIAVGAHLLDLQVTLLQQDDELASQVLYQGQSLGARFAMELLATDQVRCQGKVGLAHAFMQTLDGLDVDREALGQERLAQGLHDLRIIVGLGVGVDLEGAVEGKVAITHLPQGSDGLGHADPRAHALLAEALAGDLDGLGKEDLLGAGEQRNLAHLGQVHTHRIINLLGQDPLQGLRCSALLDLDSSRRARSLGLGLGLGKFAHGVLATLGGVGWPALAIHELYSRILQTLKDLVHLVGRNKLIFEQLVHLGKGQEAFRTAFISKKLDGLVDFYSHRWGT